MTGFPMDCAFEYGVLDKVSQTFLSRHFVAASGSYGHTEILHIPREGMWSSRNPVGRVVWLIATGLRSLLW